MALIALISALPAHADVAFTEANFPDANFRQYLMDNFSAKGFSALGANITTANLESIKTINCPRKSISNLKGIEKFTKLETLICSNNSLTSLPTLSATLTYLDCNNNQITQLDVSRNTALVRLSAENNKLSSIDITKLTALRLLNLKQNQLTSLNLTKCPDLEVVYLGQNSGLTSLNFQCNTKIQYLSIFSTGAASVDLSSCTDLRDLSCWNMQNLESIDLSGCTKLRACNLTKTKLKSLDVSNNKELRNLRCEGARLTTLDLSKQTKLLKLLCNDNNLTELDLSQCTLLDTKNAGEVTRADFFGADYTTLATTDQGTIDGYVTGGSSYRNQVRDVSAQSFKIVKNETTTIYYYLRLDDTKTSESESSLVETMTAGNFNSEPSQFDPSKATWLTGGTPINGTRGQQARKVQAPDITEDQVVGNILLLTDYTENAGTASGTVTYTYNVGHGTPTPGAFTLNWSASANPDVVTGIDDLTAALHGQPVSTTYTDLTGRQSDRPFGGVNIVTTRYSDGTVTVSKVLK